MSDASSQPLILSTEQIAFAQGEVIIYAGSTAANRRASVAHCYGCCVDDDGAVTVYVNTERAAPLLADIRVNGRIAVAFAHPGTETALQLKGEDAEITVVDTAAMDLIANYCERMVAYIIPLGFSELMLRAYLAPPQRCTGLRFTPYVAFDQTPGPHAGTRIGTSSC